LRHGEGRGGNARFVEGPSRQPSGRGAPDRRRGAGQDHPAAPGKAPERGFVSATLSTHVLDTSLGRPAEGVLIRLARRDGSDFADIGSGTTDADGRARNLVTSGQGLPPGIYRLTFGTAAYHQKQGVAAFYPEVSVQFEIREGESHYHVPLLLSP